MLSVIVIGVIVALSILPVVLEAYLHDPMHKPFRCSISWLFALPVVVGAIAILGGLE
jgi:ABC-type uncharacterized transport system YnjBCD permease subunit